MFVALRDLRSARGRFALMTVVVVLITTLVVLLSGLTAGLGRENTSAVDGLHADKLAFSASAGVSFSSSTVKEDAWKGWAAQPGVRDASPLGIAMTRLGAGERTAGGAAFGIDPAGPLAPGGARPTPGGVVLSQDLADELHVRAGDTVALGPAGNMRVDAVVPGASYSHAPVVWTTLDDWQPLTPGPRASGAKQATVVALDLGKGADIGAGDAALHTETVSKADARKGIGSYTSENGSLQLMRGFLFVISALVVGAFFTVWTVQRSGDIAVLKALGASTGYLLRDALGQALVVLTAGTALGTAIAAAAGRVAEGTVPFVLDAGTTVLPAAVMVVLGLVGAALAVRRVTAVDPLTALGSAR
ncbi:ABC transporter permease [Yinghuangia seranimata]|uniref:ABC transporter permease n=1 Tax=Yinghuangia seranimata TaxID=408067 RepID=UPI00248D3459|nr:ABC transporter permease [Yinghuangia seranimata]MDI2129958.1 ABC transporter permease [Yinghuangia seranimata]MDI2131636.1 ABC transporter permease [Yinghuangia seranimata]